MNITWEPGENGEDGHTEFVSKCEVCGRLGNMVYRNRGPRGAILKGQVIACSRRCGEPAAGIKPFAPTTTSQIIASMGDEAPELGPEFFASATLTAPGESLINENKETP